VSIASSPQSARSNGHAAAPENSTARREWDELVAREAMHQQVIEASFDRAEAYERLGDFEHALEWLDRAAELGGGLPSAYEAKRTRWDRAAARRLRPRSQRLESGSGVLASS
jgi:tetratricopeptide (TPR) repeat protein